MRRPNLTLRRRQNLDNAQIQVLMGISSLLSTYFPTSARSCAHALCQNSPQQDTENTESLGESASAINTVDFRFADCQEPQVTPCVARRAAHLCCRQASRESFVTHKGRTCLGPHCFAVRLLWREGQPHRNEIRHVGDLRSFSRNGVEVLSSPDGKFWSALKAIPSWMWRNSPTSSVLQGSGPLISPGSLSPVDRKACERFLRVRSPGSRNTIRPQRNRCWSPWMNTAAVPQDTEFFKCVRELFARGATSLPQAALSQRVITQWRASSGRASAFQEQASGPRGSWTAQALLSVPGGPSYAPNLDRHRMQKLDRDEVHPQELAAGLFSFRESQSS